MYAYVLVLNSINNVMVTISSLSVEHCGFEPQSGYTKDYKIGFCWFSAKHSVLRSTGADPGGGGGGAPDTCPPLSEIGKNKKFWHKIVIFTRNTPKIVPPSTRRNFLKCSPPLTWNPGSTPGVRLVLFRIRIMYTCGAACPSANCCFSELAL